MKNRVRCLHVLASSSILSAAVSAQTFTVLVKDNDVISGVGNVTAIDDLEVNDSGVWLVKVDTDFATTPGDGVVLLSGFVLARETDALLAPAGAGISSFGAIQLDDSNRATWNLFLTGLTTTTDSGIFRDSALVLQESTNSIAPQFGGPTPYVGFFGVKNDGASRFLVMASVDDPTVASTVDRAIVRWQLDASGVLLSESVIAKEGDLLGGVPVETVTDFSTGRHSWAFNRSGDALYLADMTGATTADGFLMKNSTLLVREGDASPIAGRNWENLLGKSLDINDNGDYVFTGNLDGATTDDEVLCENDATIIAQEGASLPAIGGVFTFSGFGSGAVGVDGAGNVFWTGDWNDPDTTRDVGIFRNDQLIVQEGVTIVGGFLVESIPTVQDDFGISRSGRYLVFECKLAGGVDAAVLVDFGLGLTPFCFGDGSGASCPCGNNGGAGRGCANSVNTAGALLSVSGAPNPDTLVLAGSGMPATVACIYLQGDASSAPGINFGDGLRCADGALIRLRTKNNVGGASQFPEAGDPSVSTRGMVTPGSGAVRYYQTYYRNSAAAFCPPDTFNVTNGCIVVW